MHSLAHRQRPLGQFVQHAADRAVGFGDGIGAAHLTKHLLLADHRRVQAAGNREQVLNCCLAVADICVLGQLPIDIPECSASTCPITDRPPWNASTTA